MVENTPPYFHSQNDSTDFREILQHLVPMKQAAQDIGVTTMTLWRWERLGMIHAYRIGREVLIEKAEVERLRKERQR